MKSGVQDPDQRSGRANVTRNGVCFWVVKDRSFLIGGLNSRPSTPGVSRGIYPLF